MTDLEGIGSDDDAFDQLVGVTLYEQVILERGRLRLIAVDDQVGHVGLAQHRPLATRREAGAAAAEQRGGIDLLAHLGRCQAEGLAQAVEAAGRQEPVEGERVVETSSRGDDAGSVGQAHAPASSR